MALSTIYPNGVIEIDIPATESIAISNFGGGIAKIYYLIERSNYPAAYQFQQTLENSSVTLGPFSSDTTVKIESGASKVLYEVGTAPDTGNGDADTLGGNPPSYYAANSTVVHVTGTETVGGIKTFGSKLKIGGGANIDFHEEIGDKIYYYDNQFGTGIEASNLTNWSFANFRWRKGGTSVSTGTEIMTLDASGNLAIDGTITPGSGTSGTFTTADAKTVTVTNGIITAIV